MSSVLCSEGRSVPLLMCLLLLMSCDAARIHRAAFMDGDVRSEVVDPNNRTIWAMFNLTEGQINRIRIDGNANGKDETTQATKNRLLDHLAGQRLNEIRSRIQIAVSNKPDTMDNQDTNRMLQDKPYHELAGYPICNGETSTHNLWQQSNNVTLQFASSVFQQYGGNRTKLDSAVLRLYKMNPKATASGTTTTSATTTIAAAAATATGTGSATNVENAAESTPSPLCSLPFQESQLRITVSIVHQQKKKRKLERKKRTCNTMMLSSSKTGWVDIDVKCALNYWAQQEHAAAHQMQMHPHPPIVVGLLMIEMHDDEENQLLPGQYFLPPTCDQADIAVPWSIHRSATHMPSMENYTMSKCPRLDVRLTGNGLVSKKNFETSNIERSMYESLKRHLNRSKGLMNTESTTLNSPTLDNMLENGQNESREKQQIHHHRRRHHHQQQQQQQLHEVPDCVSAAMISEESAQQADTQQHHHLRTHHNHNQNQHHYQHQHHQHQHQRHHKHRHAEE